MHNSRNPVKQWLQKKTPKFSYLNRSYQQKSFTLLDIGSGNHSASKTKTLFPHCEYHGVDLQKDFNNDESDYAAMHAFYEMDLTKLDFHTIPDDYFDFIRMTHVIEHLHNGDKVIAGLLPKLKRGGYIYIEYPGKKSLELPSMHGTLNFYDDPTHVRIYSVKELKDLLDAWGCTVIKGGTRRNMVFLLAMPFRVLKARLQNRPLQGNFFWDWKGFAEYVFAKKK